MRGLTEAAQGACQRAHLRRLWAIRTAIRAILAGRNRVPDLVDYIEHAWQVSPEKAAEYVWLAFWTLDLHGAANALAHVDDLLRDGAVLSPQILKQYRLADLVDAAKGRSLM